MNGAWPIWLMLGPACGPLVGAWAVAWPRKPKLLGRSTCARCGTAIPLRQQIPVVSYLLLRGRRLCCDGRIPRTYFWAELCGFGVGFGAALQPQILSAALIFLLGQTLIYAALVDLRRFVVPAQAIVCVALLWGLGIIGSDSLTLLREGAITAACVGAALYAVAFGSGRPRALGLGDIVLAMALSAWIGWMMTPIVLAISALLALGPAVRARNNQIAFGPALIAAAYPAIVAARSAPLWGF